MKPGVTKEDKHILKKYPGGQEYCEKEALDLEFSYSSTYDQSEMEAAEGLLALTHGHGMDSRE